MIPSFDTYLYKEIRERVNIILSECYIIDEALREVDETAREAFKRTYCGEHPKKVLEFSYSFPQQKESFNNARFVISLGGSVEEKKTIGGVQGDYEYREDDFETETVELVREGKDLVFNTSKPVAEITNCPGLSFAESDNIRVDSKKAKFSYFGNEELEGSKVTINYVSLRTDEDVGGLHLGYISRDTVTIVGISTNIDTVRCLDALLKVVLITIRESVPEKMDYMLQTLAFGDLQPVIENGDTVVFGRPCTIGYIATNTVSFDLNERINKIVLKRRAKPSGN